MAVSIAAQASIVLTTDSGTLSDGSGVTWTTSAWGYQNSTNGLGGFVANQGFLPGTLTFANVPTGFELLIEVLPTDNNPDGNPRTWDGVANGSLGTATTGGTFVADAGVWTDNTTSLVNGTITGTSFEGVGAAVASGTGQGVSSGANWGSVEILGATSLSYSTVTQTGADAFNFAVTVVPVTSSVPEPCSAALLGLGGLGLLIRRRK